MANYQIHPPRSITDLLQRARQLAGYKLGYLAEAATINLPQNLLYGKGSIGQLLEFHLGTTAGTKSQPDFVELGIELKTIPVNHVGKPRESTYICTVPLEKHYEIPWEQTQVFQKLARILWVPIEADPEIPVLERRVGMALLWTPTLTEEKILRKDWEEHMEKVRLGLVETITAHEGVYLQIRPKAADSTTKTQAIGPQGENIQTNPRGFYLRPQFTTMILQQAYHI